MTDPVHGRILCGLLQLESLEFQIPVINDVTMEELKKVLDRKRYCSHPQFELKPNKNALKKRREKPHRRKLTLTEEWDKVLRRE